jgi:hypothetical protein
VGHPEPGKPVASIVYIKTFTPGCVVSCEKDTVLFLLTKEKIYLKSKNITLSLKIVAKQFRAFAAEDVHGLKYTIGVFEYNKEFGLVIIPPQGSDRLMVGIADFNLCE